MKFRYTAAGAGGKICEGTVEAPDKGSAVAELSSQGLMVMELAAVAAARAEPPPTRLRPKQFSQSSLPPPPADRWSRFERACYLRQLALMLDAGLGIQDALMFLAEGRAALVWVGERVSEGQVLSGAFERSGMFSTLQVGMVRVGERTGGLVALLGRLADLEEREVAVRRRLVSQLSYPTAVLVSMTLALTVLGNFMSGVMFSVAGSEAGLLARLFSSRWMLAGALMVLAGLGWGAATAWSTPAGRAFLEGWLFRVPRLGELMIRLESARICRTLGVTVQGGLRADQALSLCASATACLRAREALEVCRQALLAGAGVAAAMEQANFFPAEVIHMAAAGEQVGRLPEMLATVAEYAEGDVERVIDSMVTLVEPFLLVTMGVAVGVIALATFAPLYRAITAL